MCNGTCTPRTLERARGLVIGSRVRCCHERSPTRRPLACDRRSPIDGGILYSASYQGFLVRIEIANDNTLQTEIPWKADGKAHSSATAAERRGPECCVMRLHHSRVHRVVLGFKNGRVLVLDNDKVAASHPASSKEEGDPIADVQARSYMPLHAVARREWEAASRA